MNPSKIDVELELLEGPGIDVAALKAGDVVHIVERDGKLVAVASDGSVLGAVPEAHASVLAAGQFVARARSLRKVAGTNELASLSLRFIRSEPGAREQGELRPPCRWGGAGSRWLHRQRSSPVQPSHP